MMKLLIEGPPFTYSLCPGCIPCKPWVPVQDAALAPPEAALLFRREVITSGGLGSGYSLLADHPPTILEGR
jgi:hypothetical protein